MALVGRDPFVDAGPLTITVVTARSPSAAAGSLTIGVDQEPQGHRAMRAPTCDALLADLALAIVVVLSAPPTVDRAKRDATEEPPRSSAHAVAIGGTPASWQLGVVGGAAASAGGRSTADIGARVRHDWWSIAAGVVVGEAEEVAVAPGMVHVDRGEIAVLPCLHAGRALACADLAAGWIAGSGSGLASPATAALPFAAAGLRAGWEQPLAGWLSLQAYVEGRVALTTNRFFVDDMAVWSGSRLEARVGIAAVAHIP